MNITTTIDLQGLACPLPIVRTKKAMDALTAGDILEVRVTDRGALNDFPAWAASCGHTIVEQKEQDELLLFYIEKGAN